MNKTQQLASGVFAVLMLATIAFVPLSGNTGITHSVSSVRPGTYLFVPLVSPELPQELVRDMTYN